MYKLATISVLICSLSTLTLSTSPAKLTLYGNHVPLDPIVISGSDCPYGATFDLDPIQFSCACMTGLWAFYEDSCSAPTLIAGGMENKCIQINEKISKVHLLSSPEGIGDAATIFSKDMKTATGRVQSDGSVTSVSINHAGPVNVVATGTSSWGFKPFGSCLTPKFGRSSQFCTFTDDSPADSMLQPACDERTTAIVPPSSCIPFLEASSECGSINSSISVRFGRSAPTVLHSKVKPVPTRGRVATSAHAHNAKATPNGRTAVFPHTGRRGRTGLKGKKGRVFLAAVNGLTNGSQIKTVLSKYDASKNLSVNIISPEMNSELWNYLTTRAQSILNLTVPKPQLPLSPSFRFLKLAKEVLQKACPNNYVPNEHFEMAVGAFTSLQTRQFNYRDTFSDRETGRRIEESLKFCRDNMTVYPFVDRINRTKETCNLTINLGTFEAFGNFSELVLPYSAASREREPIIESVWKVFTHAHAACYNHFAEGFNDHHRFTTSLMPLFTNEINLIWTSIKELKGDAYNGLLGDAQKLMDGVAYCAEYSRLETAYPWELPRPVRDVSNSATVRKRRSPLKQTSQFTCLKTSFENKC